MREIKFRGFSISEDKWVYGTPIIGILGSFILEEDKQFPSEGMNQDLIEVYEDSIGEYTPFKDKNGKSIFEGDIRAGKYYSGKDTIKFVDVMEFGEGFFTWVPKLDHYGKPDFIETEVIGNIYESHELLND